MQNMCYSCTATFVQIVGVLGALQFLASKLLFAKDRQQVFDGFKYLIQDKIAAGEAGNDMRRLADKVCLSYRADWQYSSSTSK